MNKLDEIEIVERKNPEAFVSKWIAMDVGLNYRVQYPTTFDKEFGIWTIPLRIVIPQKCDCCGQQKPPIVQDGGYVKVKRDETHKYVFVEKAVKEPNNS